jgi:gluconolactonase
MKLLSKFLTLTTLILSGTILGHAQFRTPVLKTSIEEMDPALNKIIDKDVKVEIIAKDIQWAEGPVWVESKQMLLFSDVQKNIIYKWTAEKGKELYLTPAGYTGTKPRGGDVGSNGLAVNKKGQLIICQDGDRKMAIMDAPLDKPQPKFITWVDNYMGKKFDSPNDLAFRNNGDLYFTDPPYGLEKNVNDPAKEAPYQGVYRITPNGKITLITDTLTRPNGIAFFPDGKTIIIANSDNAKPYWYAYELDKNGMFTNGRIFYNAMEATKTGRGMPDGLKIGKKGYVFAAGPGGLWIFDQTGKVLGKLKSNVLISNCTLSGDEKTIYITADMYILKVGLK